MLDSDFFEIVRQVYTSLSSNTKPFCCDLLRLQLPVLTDQHIMAIGTSNIISLTLLTKRPLSTLCPNGFKVLRALTGHISPISCLRWMDTSLDLPLLLLISLDSSGNGIVWGCDRHSFERNILTGGVWSKLFSFQTPKNSVPNAIDGFLSHIPHESISHELNFTVASENFLSTWQINLNEPKNPTSDNWLSDTCREISPKIVRDRTPSCCLCLRYIKWKMHNTQMIHLLLAGLDNGEIELWPVFSSLPASNEENVRLSPQARLTGHTDWVTSIDTSIVEDSSIFVASGGQDKIIRIWKIQLSPASQDKSKNVEFSYILESVLPGHSNWVTGVAWAPQYRFPLFNPPPLLSSSMDKSLIIWKPPGLHSSNPALWIEQTRLGNVDQVNLGYLNCFWSPDATTVYSLTYQGCLSSWNITDSDWSPGSAVCGHHGPVTDLVWVSMPHSDTSTRIRFLLTVGSDQTVRAHAPLVTLKHSSSGDWCEYPDWLELSRPQIHGYDMNAIACLTPFSYVSAGDEKVARIFQATRTFVQLLCRVSGCSVDQSLCGDVSVKEAVRPSLGLSNRVAMAGDVNVVENVNGDLPGDLHVLSEDYLQQATLWPETKKLYGHPYEVYALAVHPRLPLIASSCIASKQAHAYVILWNGKQDWSVHQHLVHHQLTVTQMSFSHGGDYLLVVSRDRTWSVWRGYVDDVDDGSECSLPKYKLTSFPLKTQGHSRIIWTCAWSPDDRFFFTGSRDKTIRVWSESTLVKSNEPSAQAPLNTRLDFNEGVTALDVCQLSTPSPNTVSYLLAVGLEHGGIRLQVFSADALNDCTVYLSTSIAFPPQWVHAPGKQVRRVAFEPGNSTVAPTVCLATCADDGIVHVYEINKSKL